MKKQTSLITLSLMLATPALAGGAGAPVPPRAAGPANCQSIAQIVMNDPQFSTLLTAVQGAGLADTLKSGQYTVFAPTNAAFAKLPSDQLAAVLNDQDMLRGVLLYHVVPGKVSSKQLTGLKSVKTAQGTNLTVSLMGNRAMVGGAHVIRADIPACNGVIHVIDTVLMPPMAAPAPGPVAAAPAPAPAAPAPTAPAAIDISKIPATPISGATSSTTGTATQTTTSTTETTATATDSTATDSTATAVAENTLYDVIVSDDRFSTLRDLLSDAGLTESLASDEYTIFAPTNEAFDALPEGTLATLEANPDLLKQVLSYHIVPGRVTAEQLASGTSLNALAGGALPLSMNGSTQMVGNAGVTETINTASNGTIYVINQVLLPPGLTLPAPESTAETATTETTVTTTTETSGTAAATTPAPTPGAANNASLASLIASDPRFSTLAGLVQQAGLTETLGSGEYTIFAPTNEAFAKLAPADLSALSADPARLKQVLLYHVVPGRITGTALAGSPQLTSAQGAALTLTRGGEPTRIMIGTAIIENGASLDAGNGVLYPIDTVLMPPTP
ncbi:fasciclin domain-containing protein [Deinococcus sp. DB0503]|uniref:fasciclin domain-containing protein n=1 Tax=Deinococcus sp. DB0503 TaxID=2479203 RepID=UPI0018DF86D5|nr:fasciclin domain-containing protein [Deinococcus sp. DB0503]MBI0445289.1 fasciclin domain-containing protein [Deinococcus sp. DB0503]